MVICPRCKEEVEGLVKKYELINTKTNKREVLEFEKSVCEICCVELYDEIKEGNLS